MIPIYKPYIYETSKKLAQQAIEVGDIAQGPFIEEFEHKFAQACDRLHGVTCCNGTVALYMAIKALDLPKGSEVIVPSMTIISCLTAIVENHLTPVFCDIDASTYNIDFESAQSKVGPNTSAMIVVNTYGLMVDLDRLKAFQEANPNIKIVEDASESHGALGLDRVAGSVGDISIFSFYTNKIVSMGEGGIILTNDADTFSKLKQIRNLNFTDRRKYVHDAAGFNFRLTNLQCAIGLGQLENMHETIRHRKRVATAYDSRLSDINIQLPAQPLGYDNVYWYYAVRVHQNYEKVLAQLTDKGIDYRHFFYPLHKQPFIQSPEVLINSQKCFESGLLLPIFNELTDEEIELITTTIKQAIWSN
jgi:perosamine synthetase